MNAKELNLDVQFEINNALKPENKEKADVIISNPPYIPRKEKAKMHQNVTDFEPDLALFVPDENPLLFYRAIAEYALNNLVDQGCFHENYAPETKLMVEELGFTSVEIKEDLQGKHRMLKAFWNVKAIQ